MRIRDVPEAAFNAEPTPVPTKIVYDWEAMHRALTKQGFVVIQSDDIRILPSGAEECILVKAFNSHMATTKKLRLKTKRISHNRWYCTL